MINIVTIIDDPERVHIEQYDIIEKLFKPKYYFRLVSIQDSSIFEHSENPDKRDVYKGAVSIAENNKDVTIKADPKLFLGIAEEIEKLGYSVTIVY